MKFIARVRELMARATNDFGTALLIYSRRLGGDALGGYDPILRNAYDCQPKGTCVFGAADKYLLVPKNRYKAVLLPNQKKNTDLGVGWITEDNTAEGYDGLWGDETNLDAYRKEAGNVRQLLTQEIVNQIEAHVQNGSEVVDIGCGVGDLLAEIRRRKPDVVVCGLDFSAKAVEVAAARFPDGKFVQHIIDETLPYTAHSFDVVLCTDVLEHLDRPQTVAAELVRICRPGGVVVVVVPDGHVDQFLGHYWFWNEESLRAMLAEWNPVVMRLPKTREILACINVKISVPTS